MRLLFLILLLAPCAALGRTVVITESNCRILERHQPRADVTYQPGVDARGKPVVPADLYTGPQIRPPDQITVNLPIPITQFLAQAPPFLDQAEIDAGKVTVDRRTGAIFYNGQRIDSPYVVQCDDEDAGQTFTLPPPRPD